MKINSYVSDLIKTEFENFVRCIIGTLPNNYFKSCSPFTILFKIIFFRCTPR